MTLPSYATSVYSQPLTKATYAVRAAVAGPSGGGPSGTNKAMVSILNPGGSGKIVRVRSLLVQAESSSGTNVIVLYELRRISAHSAGTTYTPKKRDTNDAAASTEAKTEPTVTEISNPTISSLVIQSNTAQAFPMLRFDEQESEAITLREGEGLVVHQVTSNGGTFQINLVWTEEAS